MKTTTSLEDLMEFSPEGLEILIDGANTELDHLYDRMDERPSESTMLTLVGRVNRLLEYTRVCELIQKTRGA